MAVNREINQIEDLIDLAATPEKEFVMTFFENREFIFDNNPHSKVEEVINKVKNNENLKHLRARIYTKSGQILKNRRSRKRLLDSSDREQVIKDIMHYGPLSYFSKTAQSPAVVVTGVRFGTPSAAITPMPQSKRQRTRLRQRPTSPAWTPLTFSPSIADASQVPSTGEAGAPGATAEPTGEAGAPGATAEPTAPTATPPQQPPAPAEGDATPQPPPQPTQPTPATEVVPNSPPGTGSLTNVEIKADDDPLAPWVNKLCKMLDDGNLSGVSQEIRKHVQDATTDHTNLANKVNELESLVNHLNNERGDLKERITNLENLLGANIEAQHELWGQLNAPAAGVTADQDQERPAVTEATASPPAAAPAVAPSAGQPVNPNQGPPPRQPPQAPQATPTTQIPPAPQHIPAAPMGHIAKKLDLYIGNIANKYDRKYMLSHINSQAKANLELADIIQAKKGRDGKAFKVTIPENMEEDVKKIWGPSIIVEPWRKKTFQDPKDKSNVSGGPGPHAQSGQGSGPQPHRQKGQGSGPQPHRQEGQYQLNRKN